MFSNDEATCAKFVDGLKSSGEKCWRLPCTDDYRDHIKSEIADIMNTGKNRYGGAISAAMFLKEFAGDTPWVHLDIAGCAWNEEKKPWHRLRTERDRRALDRGVGAQLFSLGRNSKPFLVDSKVRMVRTIQLLLQSRIQAILLAKYDITLAQFAVEQPPNIALGELALPVAFELAKRLRKAPRAIATELAAELNADSTALPGVASVEVAGAGYLNIRLDRAATVRAIAADRHADIGGPGFRLVEHTSINPNKAAHIGHLRNAILGDTFQRLLRPDDYKSGYQVGVQNYIDNTGVQVADVVVGLVHLEGRDLRIDAHAARLSLLRPASGSTSTAGTSMRASASGTQAPALTMLTPPTAAELSAAQADSPGHAACAGTRRQRDSRDCRPDLDRGAASASGDDGAAFDRVRLSAARERDSEPALLGRGAHADAGARRSVPRNRGQEQGLLRDAPGWNEAHAGNERRRAKPSGPDEDAKVIVRSNGTVTYVGKDIAYHLWKFGLLPGKDFGYARFHEYPTHTCWISTAAASDPAAPTFGRADAIYNVIDSRQNDPQNNVIAALRGMGFTEAADHYTHFSYEMVAMTPRCAIDLGYTLSDEDKQRPFIEVSGRKGYGVKADDLLDKLIAAAQAEVDTRHPELTGEERTQIATQIAVGALRYFMLRFTRNTVIAFDFKDALSFEGETGPYVQYAIVRAANIFRKAGTTEEACAAAIADLDLSGLGDRRRHQPVGDVAAGLAPDAC